MGLQASSEFFVLAEGSNFGTAGDFLEGRLVEGMNTSDERICATDIREFVKAANGSG